MCRRTYDNERNRGGGGGLREVTFTDRSRKCFGTGSHALAIGCSPAYLSENADGIRQDWPRIPLPDSKELLVASAALGRQIAALLDTEADVGAVREPPLRKIAVPNRVDGKPLNELVNVSGRNLSATNRCSRVSSPL